jgi:signal transduction histidine kinase
MLHEFLEANRTELIERCRAKVARRPAPRPTAGEIEHGIPLFLGQLIETLHGEQDPVAWNNPSVSTAARRKDVRSEIATGASKHGNELLRQGFTVNQVVYDYGDLCQAITELVIEKGAQIEPDEFQTLNRCLDFAIADAVTEFARQRDAIISATETRATSERLGFLAHEMRNFLNTAMLSFAAIKGGSVAGDGATAAVLERSLGGLRDLIDRALADVRLAANEPSQLEAVAVDQFIADAQVAASLEAKAKGCEFTVAPVAPGLGIRVDRPMLNSALSNLLQNAFKFTRSHSHVTLKVYGLGERVLIEIEDQCGGLPEGQADSLFLNFEQQGTDRSGLGLGLSIARRAVEANAGVLRVRDMPGLGCVFTIDLPRHKAPQEDVAHPSVIRAGHLSLAVGN